MSRRRRSASSWERTALALAGIAISALSILATPPAVAAGRFTLLRTWTPQLAPAGQSFDGDFATAQIAVDERRRVFWIAFGNPGGLAAYDLDTLLPRSGLAMLPSRARSVTVDPATGRALVVSSTTTPLSGFDNSASTAALDEYELQGSSLQQVWHDDLSSLGQDREIASLAIDAVGRAIYVASQPADSVSAGVTVSRLPLGTTAPAPQWSYAVPPTCVMVPTTGKLNTSSAGTSVSAAMAVTDGTLYFPCGVPESVARPPLASGIAKVVLAADPSTAPAAGTAFSFFPVSGNFYDSHGSQYDAVSRRLIVDEANGQSGSEVVFDVASDRFVGLIDGNANRFSGMGLDARSGRLYAMNVNPVFGLEAADVRTTPPSQPTSYPQYSYLATSPIPVDSATSRLFVVQGPSSGSPHAYYRVLRDDEPALDTASSAPDPDSNTRDIPEAAGTTGATFSTAAQGYGAVVRQVGGAQSAVQDLEGGFEIPGDSDPEFRGAYLNSASLTADEATASSIAAGRDQNFDGANQATVCASTPQQAQGTTCAWPYTPAECFSSDTLQTQASGGPGGSATSACGAEQRSVTSRADLAGADLAGVSLRSLSTSSTLLEDPVAGGTVTVTSEARDVSLAGGALRIAGVATTATAHAHGRPGTAGTSFSRTVEGVVLNGTTLCDTQCDLGVVSNQVASAFGGRLVIDFPSPDAGFAKGSPGGYQALVRLAETAHLEQVLLSDQPANRVEVPGMVVQWKLDTARPSQTLVMLAGVEAEAHYGIYPLDQFTADQSAGLAPGASDLTVPPLGSDAPLAAGVGGPFAAVAGTPSARSSAPMSAISALPALLGWHGWQWALTHPAEMLRLAAVWAVFLVPIYLAARRWSLLRRHHLEVDLA